MTRNEFIKRAQKNQLKLFGEILNFDYSRVPEKVTCRDTVQIICLKHKDTPFEKRADMFIYGCKCPRCSENNKRRIIDTKTFIELAQKIHQNPDGTPKYDYSLSACTHGTKSYTVIYCHKKDEFGQEHGEFVVNVASHLNGTKCPKCSGCRRPTTEDFIKRAQQIHQNPDGTPKYDYSKTKYVGLKHKITITCPKHGDFEVMAHHHICGIKLSGCPVCSGGKLNTQEFIKRAQQIHQNPDGTPKYDYSKTKYINARTKVTITCPKHGDFTQLSRTHILGSDCPQCSLARISKLEKEVLEFVKTLTNEGVLENYRGLFVDRLELDIYVPSRKIAIEFDGIYYHSFKESNYHLLKTEKCESKGIRLIHIFENEWLEKKPIVKDRLRHIFGASSNKVSARKCYIKEVPVNDERYFFDKINLEGYIESQICYGLYYPNRDEQGNEIHYLVAAMSFREISPKVFELCRFATLRNFCIVGAATKLFNCFLKEYNPNKVVTFADRRYVSRLGKNIYDTLGFRFNSVTPPSQQDCFIRNLVYKVYNCGYFEYIWEPNVTQIKISSQPT